MEAKRAAEVRQLRGLKNISWLSSRQITRTRRRALHGHGREAGIIIDDKHSPELAFILLSGVARITCRNRKGDRTLVIVVAPGMIPGFPPPVPLSYNFRCEAVTECQVGTI